MVFWDCFLLGKASRAARRLFDERIVTSSPAPQKSCRVLLPCFPLSLRMSSSVIAGLGHRLFDAARYPAPYMSLSTIGDVRSRWIDFLYSGSESCRGMLPFTRGRVVFIHVVSHFVVSTSWSSTFFQQTTFCSFYLYGSGSAVNTPFDLGSIPL